MSSQIDENAERRSLLWQYAPLIIWIGVIFFLSSAQGSMTETSRFIRPLLEFLFPNASEASLQLYHGYIRKFAHFAEYGVLALLAWRAFTSASIRFVQRFPFTAAFLLVLLIASIDELNQSLIASRTGSLYDVSIDLMGGLAVLGILRAFHGRSRIRYSSTTDRPTVPQETPR